ncbi:MAG: tetratricopeptide repeat protein [Chitinivibrionales bacterium]|nr:tetratricopeptide repeat protein [Chitinivibrionales bacterium]
MYSREYEEYKRLFSAHAFSDALAFAERMSVACSDTSEFWLTCQAAALNQLGRYNRALRIINKALAVAPENIFALLAMADSCAGKGAYERAIALYGELRQKPKVKPRAQRALLFCFSRMKKWNEILTAVAEWNLAPGQKYLWKAKALAGLDRYDEAVDACNRWLEAEPHNPQAIWQMVSLEVTLEGIEATRKKYGRLAKIPSLPPIYNEVYASLCRKTGNAETALSEYEKLARTGADPRITRKKAFALAKSGGEREAIPMFEELLRLNPNDMYIHSSYYAACKRIGDPGRAANLYRELLSLYPEEKKLYGRLRKTEKDISYRADKKMRPYDKKNR